MDAIVPRNILLVEPKYKNKYPPIGLMKIATYHKMIGDKVSFFKGDVQDLILNSLVEDCKNELSKWDQNIDWNTYSTTIFKYIRVKNEPLLIKSELGTQEKFPEILTVLNKYSHIYRKKDYVSFPKWDRIYVTTLFTFYWKVTVKAIHAVKPLVRNIKDIYVGGVLASLLTDELLSETGIQAISGLLDKAGTLDPGLTAAQEIVIDDLPLDYSILEEIEYKYPTGSAYFTFMTKGCTRKCKFCSVPILEPTYKPKIPTLDKFLEIKEKFGEQQHLLLMDNNVLASPNFSEIIEEIKTMGFYNGATFIEPNQLDIAITNLKNCYNDKAYIKKSHDLIIKLYNRLKGKNKAKFYQTLVTHNILNKTDIKKQDILNVYIEVKNIYEKYRSKLPKARYVDFNQGTDARYVTGEIMELMSQIPIRPLRIAFDYWGIKDQYEKAIRLAAKYEIKELSNYILYNFNDTPDELYKRLEINVALNKELGMRIYSFPMKYIPLFGEEAKSRDHVGKNWNRKYIRAIQSILNVTKGIVAPGSNFFELAFGRNIDEFRLLLEMPEEYIIYRNYFEKIGFTDQWKKEFNNLDLKEKLELYSITHSNNFKNLENFGCSYNVKHVLRHYLIKKSPQNIAGYNQIKREYNSLIKKDKFIELTLTYDFEREVILRDKLFKAS